MYVHTILRGKKLWERWVSLVLYSSKSREIKQTKGLFFSFRVNKAKDMLNFALRQTIMEPSIQTLKQLLQSKHNEGLISQLAGGEH